MMTQCNVCVGKKGLIGKLATVITGTSPFFPPTPLQSRRLGFLQLWLSSQRGATTSRTEIGYKNVLVQVCLHGLFTQPCGLGIMVDIYKIRQNNSSLKSH